MIRVYDKDLDAMVRIKYNGMDLDDYLMRFANEVKQAHDAAMTVLSKVISNNIQI